MALEKLVFDVGNDVKVEFKLELEIHGYEGTKSFSAFVPVAAIHKRRRENHCFGYNGNKSDFAATLSSSLFPYTGDDDNGRIENALAMAKIYSYMLEQGYVKINEGSYDPDSGDLLKTRVFPTFNDYQKCRRKDLDFANFKKMADAVK